MATLQQIKDAVDAKLATLWTAIQSREDTFLAANGRYFQGLRTHATAPADGATALPDIGTTVPIGQPGAPWPAAIRNTAMEMAIQIDVYHAPGGQKGYQATVYVEVLGHLYARTQQVGPETWRVMGWTDTTAVGP